MAAARGQRRGGAEPGGGGLVYFTWKVTGGQINPQAVYYATVELTGGNPKTTKLVGQQPLAQFSFQPGKMPNEGQVNTPIQATGEANYHIRVFEQMPGQPQPRLVIQHNGGIAVK